MSRLVFLPPFMKKLLQSGLHAWSDSPVLTLRALPMAAVTNDCRPGGLKQHRCIISSCRLECDMHVFGLKSGRSRDAFILEALGESLFFAFSISRGSLHALAHGPVLHLQSQQRLLSHFSHCFTLTSSVVASPSDSLLLPSSSSTFRDHCDYVVLTQIIQDFSPC